MRDIQDFDSIKIKLASPDDIRSWSYGEVKKQETIVLSDQRKTDFSVNAFSELQRNGNVTAENLSQFATRA